MSESWLENKLTAGFKQLGLELPAGPFAHYLSLLCKWNQAYNLTAVRDQETMITRHIFDSLALLPWMKGARMIDVGSGPGLPGIPLALARPDLHVVLLDSNGKKTRFLNEVKRRLALNHVEVVQSRVENYHPTHDFDTVTSRAFSELQQFIHWTRHLIAADGVWLAMKGRYPEQELAAIDNPYRVEPYTVSGLEGERCCVIINKE